MMSGFVPGQSTFEEVARRTAEAALRRPPAVVTT